MKVDKARCFHCGRMFEPWTNEWYCSDECHDAAQQARQANDAGGISSDRSATALTCET